MALDAAVKIDGLKELDATLKLLPEKIARNLMRRAISRGGAVFRKEMIATAPRRVKEPAERKYGPIWKNIRLSTRFRRSTGEITGKVGPNAKVAFYARFYEFGTSHQRARPWLRPLFIRNAGKALDAMVAFMRKEIPAAVGK
jgi:HK97 gp10 family phage protein